MPQQCADFIHLSNILDWIDPAEAQRLLGNAQRCLSPGGVVVIRQLNSGLDITEIPSGFQYPAKRSNIEQGFQLGAYVFDRLYRDLLQVS